MARGRGISREQVLDAISEIAREGQNPTIQRIRDKIGGSPNTVHAYLSEWREQLDGVEEGEIELSDYTLSLFEKIKHAVTREASQLASVSSEKVKGELTQAKSELEQICAWATKWESENLELQEQQGQIIDCSNRLEAVNQQLESELKAERKIRIEIEKKIAVLEYENSRLAQELKEERHSRIEIEKQLACRGAEGKD